MDAEFNVVLPEQAYYTPPKSLPAGMRTTKLRQPTITSLQAGNPAAVEIQIIIPHLDGCFLDPTTTSIELDGAVQVTFTCASGSYFLLSPSNSNGGFIGSAASMFSRYQVWLNNAILSDDINEFGLVTYVSLMLSLNRTQKLAMHQMLGLHPTCPEGNWGTPFHGQDFHHRASMAITGHVAVTAADVAGTQGANTNMGISAAAIAGTWRPIDGHFWAAPANNVTGTGNVVLAQPAVVCTCTQHFSFAIQLPGLLGSGNPKLFPLFNGPTRISLYTDIINQYYALDFSTKQPAAQNINAAITSYVPTSAPAITLYAVNFVGDYVRCDPASFNAIMQNLPAPNMIVMKTASWNVATAPLAKGSQGSADSACPHRKASVKACYLHFVPSGPLSDNAANAYAYNLKGKYDSVNPNLTSGTHIALNGVPYPQQTYDPMNRPQECLVDLYKSLQTWSNDAVKPSLPFRNWSVCDNLGSPVNPIAIGLGSAVQTAGYGGTGLWRQVDTTTYRTACIPANASILTGALVNSPMGREAAMRDSSTVANLFTIRTNAQNALIANATAVSMTDKTGIIDRAATTAATGDGMVFWEGTSSTENSETGIQNIQSGFSHGYMANQFLLGFDFEHLAKPAYLSGTSTLTGSFFLKMNILNSLRLAYTIYYIVCFDMLTILDVALRTAVVKQ